MRTGRPPSIERVRLQCDACGADVYRRITDMARNTSGRVFCDAACLASVGAKPRKGETVECAREGCGRLFYRGPNERQRYCSRPCKDIGSRVEVLTFICEYCGGPFMVVPGQAKYNSNKFCSREHMTLARRKAALGRRKTTPDGYVLVKQPDHPAAQIEGWIMEHRLVMEELLGRPLLPGENVHHVNGHRDDNRTDGPLVAFRSGNLELWSSSQPSGQRVVDKIAFAFGLLRTYAPDMPPQDLVSFAREMLGRYGDDAEQLRYSA